jgi:hypothetical protein
MSMHPKVDMLHCILCNFHPVESDLMVDEPFALKLDVHCVPLIHIKMPNLTKN